MVAPVGANPTESAYARGVYLVLAVLAALPLFGALAALVELAVAITLVGGGGVPAFTVTAGAFEAGALLFQGALLLAVLRGRLTPDRLRAGSWVLPILLAASSVVAVAGSIGVRVVTTRLLTATGNLTAYARHAQVSVVLGVVFALGGAAVVATALLLAFGRWRSASGG